MHLPSGTRLPLLCVCFLTMIAPLSQAASTELEELKQSVVRIVNYSQRGDWSAPWAVSSAHESYGTGFVISDGQIMTNAHVVSDSRLLIVQFVDDPTPYPAEVVHIAHDCDLALIRVRDNPMTTPVPALQFGEATALGDVVDTLGFPSGGIQVSSSRGVVSRIEQTLYVHSGADLHSAVQTDAAINPGASGGPVVHDGHVVGVAFQTVFDLENTGYFIPSEVIERFLEDVEDDRYDGYPELGVDTANLQNPAQRAQLGMQEDETGVRIFQIHGASSSAGRLQVGDVLLEINGSPIANDGTVADSQARIPFGMLIDRKFIGDKVTAHVLRSDKRLDVELTLTGLRQFDSMRNSYDQAPRFFVYGGIVFVELSRETLKTFSPQWHIEGPKTLVDSFLYRRIAVPQMDTRTQVVLLRRLKHSVNASMAWFKNQVVERANGVDVVNLEALIEAIEGHDGEFHLLEFTHGRRFGVLDREAAEAANDDIMQIYGLPQDRQL